MKGEKKCPIVKEKGALSERIKKYYYFFIDAIANHRIQDGN